MNYTLRKVNCKVLVVVVFCLISIVSSVRVACAYERVYIYTSGDFGLSGGFIPELANVKQTYVLDVSPRSLSFSSFVVLSYDSLADLVYYCNEHGLSTTLVYNNACSMYVALVQDREFKITAGKTVSITGCLGNSAGKVYVAEKQTVGGNTTTNNTYNFNQTIINNPGGSAGSSPGYGGNVSSSTTDRKLQEDIYYQTWYIGEYIHLLVDWTKIIEDEVYAIYKQVNDNIVPALSAINDNLISFKDSTISELGSIYTVLEYTHDVQLNALNVQNRIYSSVVGISSRLDTLVTNSAGIGSRLDSIITNGAVQVNTASVDARLDKIISMYSKVNSILLDTAAVNGGQITGAVGGALQDVMIYGRTRRENFQLTAAVPGLSVNGAPTSFGDAMLRAVFFNGAVPTYITDDATLSAGLWKSGSTNYVSDTYNVATGEHIQRVNTVVLTGEEAWSMAARAGDANIFYTSFPGQRLAAQSSRYSYVAPSTAFTQGSANVDDLAGSFTSYANALRFVAKVSSVDNWKAYLRNQVAAGTPVTVYWIPDPATEGTGTVSSWYADSATIIIPEGDSTITADGLRVTAKYETYDSYTKTADIIAAIDRLQLGVAPDLNPIVSRLDTLISQSSDTVVNVVTNNTYITNVYQLDEENDVADRSKEGIEKIGGVFKWLWKHAFKDAFGAADITKLDGLL